MGCGVTTQFVLILKYTNIIITKSDKTALGLASYALRRLKL